MITASQWEAFTSARKLELVGQRVFIPTNMLNVKSGYYTDAEMAQLIRRAQYLGKANVVRFLVEML